MERKEEESVGRPLTHEFVSPEGASSTAVNAADASAQMETLEQRPAQHNQSLPHNSVSVCGVR